MGVLFSFWFLMVFTLVPISSDLANPKTIQNQLGEYHSVAGHPKAKGVNLKIKAPKGWDVKEGDRPNVVVKFVKGTSNFLIQIKEAPTFISKKQANELVSDPKYKEDLLKEFSSVFENVRITNQRIVTIDRFIAYELELSGSMQQVGLTLNTRMKIWQIFYEDRFVILQGATLSESNFQPMLNFFTLLSNSVIFPDQY